MAGECSLKKTECVLLKQSHQSNTNLKVELESEHFTFYVSICWTLNSILYLEIPLTALYGKKVTVLSIFMIYCI